jgi:hypothetical protein
MALDLLPPAVVTLTPNPTPPAPPPEKPPDPSLSNLFPEKTPYHALDNPYVEPLPKETEENYKCILKELVMDLRALFTHDSLAPLSFQGTNIGTSLSVESFNAAVITILMTLESGYNPAQNTPLSTRDWARLACSIIAATGWGYHKTTTSAPESSLDQIKAATLDNDPIELKYPTLFHRLAIMAEQLEHTIASDVEDYQDWYFNLRLKTEQNMAKLATAELEEKWRDWKAAQIDC